MLRFPIGICCGLWGSCTAAFRKANRQQGNPPPKPRAPKQNLNLLPLHLHSSQPSSWLNFTFYFHLHALFLASAIEMLSKLLRQESSHPRRSTDQPRVSSLTTEQTVPNFPLFTMPPSSLSGDDDDVTQDGGSTGMSSIIFSLFTISTYAVRRPLASPPWCASLFKS
jgi:hypothetical protein